MTTLISLGCNCHPAWWLRKLQLRTKLLPFDWLFSKPHEGLAYALKVQANDFADCFEDVVLNAGVRPYSTHYPEVELFHHHDLVADDPKLRAAEKGKLVSRARAFRDVIRNERVALIYCYDLRTHLPFPADLEAFRQSVDIALQTWPSAALHVYFMFDTPGLLQDSLLTPRPRLVEYAYFRDQSVHKN